MEILADEASPEWCLRPQEIPREVRMHQWQLSCNSRERSPKGRRPRKWWMEPLHGDGNGCLLCNAGGRNGSMFSYSRRKPPSWQSIRPSWRLWEMSGHRALLRRRPLFRKRLSSFRLPLKRRLLPQRDNHPPFPLAARAGARYEGTSSRILRRDDDTTCLRWSAPSQQPLEAQARAPLLRPRVHERAGLARRVATHPSAGFATTGWARSWRVQRQIVR